MTIKVILTNNIKHMSSKFFYLTFWIIIICLGCNEEDTITPENNPPQATKNFIMPLGASRVEGNRPNFESYRYELWKLLENNGWEFDFMGTVQDDASYPNINGQSFDTDHEGRGGFTSGQILSGIEEWLNEAGSPDIVLFSSPGGNDALQNLSYSEAVANINAIIDAIQAKNPNVTILIEQMAPALSSEMTPTLSSYFNQMQQDVITIAAQQTTETSQVLTVDMFNGFTDAMLADAVHYNEAGASFIASRYYAVLTEILEQ